MDHAAINFCENSIFHEKRLQVVNGLSFLLATRQLIESGILHLVENEPAIDFCFANNRSCPLSSGIDYDQKKIVTASDFSALGPLSENERWLAVYGSDNAIAQTLFFNSLQPNGFDFHFAGGFYRDVLASICCKVTSDSLRETEQLLDLTCVDVPNLQQLSIENIVAIRQSDTAFENWRKTLRKGLREARLRDGTTSQSLLGAFMKDAKEKLDNEIQQSSFLSAAKSAFVSFGVGAFSGSMTGSVTAAIIGSGVSASAEFLRSRLDSVGTNSQEFASVNAASFYIT